MRYLKHKKQLHVSVGELLWREKENDASGLNLDNRLELGVLAHQYRVDSQMERFEAYKREVRLNHIIEIDDTEVHLHGRVDGIYENEGCFYLEEIKSVINTVIFDFSETHRLQCAVYTWMYKTITSRRSRGLVSQVGIFDQSYKEEELEINFEYVEELVINRATLILDWFKKETDRLEKRKKLVSELKWPYKKWREGQEEIWDTIQKTIVSKRNLMLEASTGSGKSAPVLLSALKSSISKNYRLAFATSRTSQQEARIGLLLESAPEEALGRVVLIGSRLNLKQKAFLDEQEILESNKLKFSLFEAPDWFNDILDNNHIFTPEKIINWSRENNVPASFLQSELIKRADIIIGDQNIISNPLYTPSGWFRNNIINREIVLLIDEAHGLPWRLRNNIASSASLKGIKDLIENLDFLAEKFENPVLLDETIHCLETLYADIKDYLKNETSDSSQNYELIDLNSTQLAISFQKCVISLTSTSVAKIYLNSNTTLSSIFTSMLVLENPESWAVYFDKSKKSICFDLIDCGVLYKERWKKCISVIAFSATLSPYSHYVSEFGLKIDRTDQLYLADIYTQEQRLILRYTAINTAYTQRQEYNSELTTLFHGITKIGQGRWMIFLPSYTYLHELEMHLKAAGISSVTFAPGMSSKLFLRMLSINKDARLILMVLGGSLAEGSDFGDINFDGVAVVGPGIAPANPLSELLSINWDSEEESGFKKAYLIPALTKVVQSVGRLIRGLDQRGIVLLIGQRYIRRDIEECLPESWRESEEITDTEALNDKIINWL